LFYTAIFKVDINSYFVITQHAKHSLFEHCMIECEILLPIPLCPSSSSQYEHISLALIIFIISANQAPAIISNANMIRLYYFMIPAVFDMPKIIEQKFSHCLSNSAHVLSWLP
jgi:hypothetical protein